MIPIKLEDSILWRRLDSPGHDCCGLWVFEDSRYLQGVAVFCSEGGPCKLEYRIDSDLSWHTRSVSVTGWTGKSPVSIEISAGPGGIWYMNGECQSSEVAGLVDVDLGFTPATNLVQLCRMTLEIGQEAEAPAVYLDFPSFTLCKLQQSYRRVAADKYEYRSPSFDYSAVLRVNEKGFVMDYPGLWEKEGESAALIR